MFLKTYHVVLLIILMITLHTYSESNIPEVNFAISVDGGKILPYKINADTLEKVIKDNQEQSSLITANKVLTVLREFSVLPSNYKKTLIKSSRGADSKHYDIKFNKIGKLHTVVDHEKCIVKSTTLGISNRSQVPKGELLNDSLALKLFVTYFNNESDDLSNYNVFLSTFGKHTFLIIIRYKSQTPSFSKRYIINRITGKIYDHSLEFLASAINREFNRPTSMEDYRNITDKFIALNQKDRTIIINSINDIPGYQKNTLDSDLEKLISKPYIISNKKYKKVFVIFTYQQIGGTVRCYRLPFSEKGYLSRPKIIELGEDIGEANYRI